MVADATPKTTDAEPADNWTVQQMVNEVSTRTGLSPGVCEKVTGTVLSVFLHEDRGHAMALFDRLQGALELAQAYDVINAQPPQNEGVVSILLRKIDAQFNEPTQAALNGVSQLAQSGLSVDELRQASSVLFSQLKLAAGPAAVANALSSAPMLRKSLGL